MTRSYYGVPADQLSDIRHVHMHTCMHVHVHVHVHTHVHTHCIHMQANEMAAAIASRAPMVVGLLEKQLTHTQTMHTRCIDDAYTMHIPSI